MRLVVQRERMLSVCVCGLGEGGRGGKEETLSKLFRLLSEKESTFKGNGSFLFLIELILFHDGIGVQERQQDFTKADSLQGQETS